MKYENEEWIDKIRDYCLQYDIPLAYLPEIIADPKVIPMIRGKAFEFSVMLRLAEILSPNEWIVDKPLINAQFGLYDTDVRMLHNPKFLLNCLLKVKEMVIYHLLKYEYT